MNDVRLFGKQQLPQAKCEGEIVIAGTIDVPDGDSRVTRSGIYAGIGRTHQRSVDSALLKCPRQVNYLLGTTIKMASGFDMQYFHWAQNSLEKKNECHSNARPYADDAPVHEHQGGISRHAGVLSHGRFL
jgi:hypothetical protein